MISDSLLASASVVPASSAASVGRSPTAPVMPLRTTSAGTAGGLDRGLLPQPGERRRELGHLRARTARGCDPPAVRPTTRNRSGLARTRSRAWVPIDPVDPRMTTSRGLTGTSSQPAGRPAAQAEGLGLLIRLWRPGTGQHHGRDPGAAHPQPCP